MTDDDQGFSHSSWRQQWIENGMPWASEGIDAPPRNWDPTAQLRHLADNSREEPKTPFEPFVLVALLPHVAIFPGPSDPDRLDVAVRLWAEGADHVVGLVRAFYQTQADRERVRIYGVLIEDRADPDALRDSCADVIRRSSGGRLAIEVAVPSTSLPEAQQRLFDVGRVLWSLDPL